jgi:hypothetical protein
MIAAVLVVSLCVWLGAGNLRAEAVARDYFSHAHGGASVANVEVDGVTLALPPFWQVEIHGDVIEPGRTGSAYESAMRLWVEPVSGFVLAMGAG